MYSNKSEDLTGFQNKVLVCKECGETFDFTPGEQEFYATKGFENEPRRCKNCRNSRKMRSDREMYTTVCSACGNEARVPFKPSNDKPVLCSKCYSEKNNNH
jgi:CxxC-x17-CxxC domain-containing protein